MEWIKKILDAIDRMWIVETIWYRLSSNGRETRDVSKFLSQQLNSILVHLIVENNSWQGNDMTNDEKIISILEWVKDNITYVTDKVQYRTQEYWATVTETVMNLQGDCEDGAILIYALARQAGIPVTQIKLCAGDVKSGVGAAGHAWIRYVSNKYPYNAFYIDWCYWYDKRPIEKRIAYLDYWKPIRPLNGNYKGIWFMADEIKGTKGFR